MLRWIVCVWLLLSCLIIVGCARHSSTSPVGRPPRPDKKLGIKAELSVEPSSLSRSTGGRISIRIYATNLSDDPKILEFDTSKRYSVYAFDTEGRKYQLGAPGEPIPSTMQLEGRATKLFEMGWDGHIWTDGDVVYLSPGRYEIEARIKNAYSNTEFVWVKE